MSAGKEELTNIYDIGEINNVIVLSIRSINLSTGLIVNTYITPNRSVIINIDIPAKKLYNLPLNKPRIIDVNADAAIVYKTIFIDDSKSILTFIKSL